MTGHERDDTGATAPHVAVDAALERAWRDASDEQPPAALDAAIIAAAGESQARAGNVRTIVAAARPRSSLPFARWQPLAVAASVAGLALVLVQVLPREPDIAPTGLDKPRLESAEFATPDAGGSVSGAESLRQQIPPVEARSSAPRRAQQRAVLDEPAAPVEEAAPADGNAAPAAAARASSGIEPSPDPQAWAARIDALHAAGDLDAAAASLRSFRAAYAGADAFLPLPLRDWARTVE